MINTSSRQHLIIRSKLISRLRYFLDSRGFLEVETPILSTNIGGANANPFKTFSKSLNSDLFLRISPELYLKQLIIGGFEKVYEIGKQFRNEGIDHTHNPEFTTCEFYQAYSDYQSLMNLTEELLFDLVTHLIGKPIIQLTNKHGQIINIDFTPPFKKIEIIPELEKFLNCSLPDINNEDSIPILSSHCEKYHISCPFPHTPARLFEKLMNHFIEKNCIQPTFLYNYPEILSPLARKHDFKAGITERFELFINGSEICNAYSELNDPKEQRKRFQQQIKLKELGETEIQIKDEIFCEALEYGLPPTGGWGMGIDRFCMLLTNQSNIKEVISFPLTKSSDIIKEEEKVN
jgi:lysyl-tRNA synthetase class 2